MLILCLVECNALLLLCGMAPQLFGFAAKLYLPKVNRSSGPATDMWIKVLLNLFLAISARFPLLSSMSEICDKI